MTAIIPIVLIALLIVGTLGYVLRPLLDAKDRKDWSWSGTGTAALTTDELIVRRDATKYDVKDAVKAFYNVTPVKVNIVNKSPRQFMSRSKGRKVSQKGMKKAYVYLKDGDRIDLV